MKKFLFLALFCALAANCSESARADKISAAGITSILHKANEISAASATGTAYKADEISNRGATQKQAPARKAVPMQSSKRREFRGRICKAAS